MTSLKRVLTKTHAVAFAVVALSSTAYAGELDKIEDALVSGTPHIDIRYRFERVDDAGFTKDAEANTIRAKVGYTTAKYRALQAGIEFENNNHLGSENFNDTKNGNTAYPTIADPAKTEVNHAWLSIDAIPDTILKIGRQPINLDNERFVGTVGYRQIDQSFDAFSVTNTSIPHTTIFYSFVENVNRIQGDDFATGNYEGKSHLINASVKVKDYGKVTGYGYLLDFDDMALRTSNSATWGLRFKGNYPVCDSVRAHYAVEYADQDDWADNTVDYSSSYLHGKLGLSYAGFKLTYSYESLEGHAEANKAFQTVLATSHKFNGWADKFTTTPTEGLNDSNIRLSYHVNRVPGDFGKFLNGFKIGASYHDFEAEHGNDHYGDELDLFIKRTFRGHYKFKLAYADFQADASNGAGLSDTEKLTFSVTASF